MIEVQDTINIGSLSYVVLLKTKVEGRMYYLLNQLNEETPTKEYLMVYYDSSNQLRAISDEEQAKKVFSAFQELLKDVFEMGDLNE